MRLILNFLLLAVAIQSVFGLIEELSIDNDDRNSFHIESFGFEADGVLKMEVSDFKLFFYPGYEYGGQIAFVLEASDSESGVRIDNNFDPSSCLHKSESLREDSLIIPLEISEDHTVFTFEQTMIVPDYYHLYFSNCEVGTRVHFHLHLEEYNVDPITGKKIYLSTGEASLPVIFGIIAVLYILLMVVWIRFLSTEKDQIKRVHLLMTLVLGLKILAMALEALKYSSLSSGGMPDAWDIAYVVVNFVRGMLMFSTIVLIGTGWSLLKPFLTEKDTNILIAIVVIQFMVNVALVVLDEENPGSYIWLSWRDFLYIVDIICCCGVLIPIVNSINHLKEGAQGSGKRATNLARLQSFRSFYLLVVGYIYFSRLIVYLLSEMLSFENVWIAPTFEEIANIIFFAWTGYLFRPQERILYLPIEEDSIPFSAIDEHDMFLEDDEELEDV